VNMLFAFGLSRLGVVAGVAITIPYVAVFAALVFADRMRGLGGFDVFLLLVGLSVAVMADYLLESSTRGLFWQRRLIAAQREELSREQEKSEALIRNVLPNPIAMRLRENPQSLADVYPDVSVLFADIVGFTGIASRIGPSDTVLMLNDLFSRFDEIAGRHGLEKIKTIGDAYMAVAGAPDSLADHARRAVAMGLDMLAVTRSFAAAEGEPLGLRVGVNSGPVVAGVIGRARLSYDLWGDTVNVASRMESQGVEGAIQVTEATMNAVRAAIAGEDGAPLRIEDRGEIDVRGRGRMHTFLVWPAEPGGPGSAPAASTPDPTPTGL
jgi:class 3 adenylate cyclase